MVVDQANLAIDGQLDIEDSPKRPAEVGHVVGYPAKAERHLAWGPRTSFERLIRPRADADLLVLIGGRFSQQRHARRVTSR